MNNQAQVAYHSLRATSAIAGDAVQVDVLAAVPLKADGALVRLYLHHLPETVSILPDAAGGPVWSRRFADAVIMDVAPDAAGRVHLPLTGCNMQMAVCPDEAAQFAGRNVLVGLCNGESADTVLQWLVWHRRQHTITGALIVERGPDNAGQKLAAALSDLIAADGVASAQLTGVAILVVDCDRPLGHATSGHEADLMNAPDAPGKDRMTPPEPDAWRSPLAYKPLLDLLHRKFLARALAVAQIDVIDLIAPPVAGVTVFEQVLQNRTGIIALQGRMVYPWGLRKAAQPTFADHICKRFDDLTHQTRWCVAVQRLPTDAIWLQYRILGSRNADGAAGFHRFMALRYGRLNNASTGQIAPKTSLIEDPELVARALASGAKPLRPPVDGVTQAALVRATAPQGNRVAVVTTMKNEGPFILEWIAYHRAIGVSDFLVYTNDCDDGTDTFLQLLDRKGICQWRENPYRTSDMKPQHAALDAANDEAAVKGADWVICMDVDEYIAIHTGDGTLPALFGAIGDANMISLTWRLFGNADIDAYRDGFITQGFTRCANAFANKPHQAWGFKTLYRNIGLFRKMGVHRPKGLQPAAVDHIRWVNGSGQPLPQKEWRTAWRSHAGTYGYDLVTLNHYAVRSAESFLVKRDRGRVNHVDRDQGLAYWFRMNHNVVENTQMQAFLPKLDAEYQQLMADPEIRAAHAGCVAAHQAKIALLKTQSKYREFHAVLTSDRMQKLARLHGHFGSNVYLAGPDVIPDDVVAQAPDAPFFFTVGKVEDTNH